MYGATKVLKNVDLTIHEGEFVSIRGKSGAGKTNLFKILGLLQTPTHGTVTYLGQDTQTLKDDQKASLRLHQFGLVFQFFNLLPTLSVMENIELPMALAGVKKPQRRARASELLGYFGLEAVSERSPESLSGGERQRVALIRALVNRPRVLLADEPTSSLDDENSGLVWDMLGRINREEGVTVVATSTDLYEAARLGVTYELRNGVLGKYEG
ncbi:MAG: ABC transporter ATP-binding protein [Candidatus Bathyarchaeota archaeon]|nr:ABC transporter ATP-binding protein [Candidatus Bathyarchaeota archaeon]